MCAHAGSRDFAPRVLLIDAVDRNLADFPINHNLIVVLHYGGSGDDAVSERVAYRLHIGKLDEISFHFRDVLPARDIVRVDEIRADTPNLIEDQVLARKRNGDDQNDGGIADDEAESSKESSQPVRPQRLQTEVDSLGEIQLSDCADALVRRRLAR